MEHHEKFSKFLVRNRNIFSTGGISNRISEGSSIIQFNEQKLLTVVIESTFLKKLISINENFQPDDQDLVTPETESAFEKKFVSIDENLKKIRELISNLMTNIFEIYSVTQNDQENIVFKSIIFAVIFTSTFDVLWVIENVQNRLRDLYSTVSNNILFGFLPGSFSIENPKKKKSARNISTVEKKSEKFDILSKIESSISIVESFVLTISQFDITVTHPMTNSKTSRINVLVYAQISISNEKKRIFFVRFVFFSINLFDFSNIFSVVHLSVSSFLFSHFVTFSRLSLKTNYHFFSLKKNKKNCFAISI